MIYTLADLRTYAREDLDNRLADVTLYPDTWIDRRIQEGIAISQDMKAIFYAKEKYDMTTNFKAVLDGGDGLTEVEIILQKEPQSVYSVKCNLDYFIVTITLNNHIILTKKKDAPDVIDKTVEVFYLFYPTIPFVTLEMTLEMYRFIKYGIAISLYEKLQDTDSTQYYLAKAKEMISTASFDIDKEMLATPNTKLWSKSWA